MKKQKPAAPAPAVSTPRESSAPAPRKRSSKARYVRYAIYGLIVVAGIALRFYLAGPTIPLPELADLDPVLVEEIENARAVIWQSPRRPEAWARMGLLLAAHGFSADSAECFVKAGELDAKVWKWPYLRAVALEGDDPAAARDALREAAVLADDDDPLPKLVLIERLLELGEFEEAERHLKIALRFWPDNPRVNLNHGRLLFARGDVANCIAPLEKAAADRHTRRAALRLLAQVHRRLGDEAASAEAVAAINDLPPDEEWPDPLRRQFDLFRISKGAYIARITQLGERGDDENASRIAGEAIARYPDLAHLVAGRERLSRQDAAGAEVALRKALAIDPRSTDALVLLGDALVLQQKFAAAEEVFRQAIEINPAAGQAYLQLGRCLVSQMKYKAAVSPLRAAVQYMPLSADAHRELARALSESGEPEEAAVHEQHAERLKSRSAASPAGPTPP
jgi:Tfp pilus assembly protein PilF